MATTIDKAKIIELLGDPRTAPAVLDIIHGDPMLRAWWEASKGFWQTFAPRRDQPELYDQQESFMRSNATGVIGLIGGNAAGTTLCALMKAAVFMLQKQPPPRKDTPFWILSNTFELTIESAWKEKLWGRGIVPDCEVDWDRVVWYDRKQNLPTKVPLKPWPKGRGGDPKKNWMIEFKSYDQGRELMQARAIGGFLFMEQFPYELLTEVLRGCREYNFPGSKLFEFTPIDPSLSVEIEDMIINDALPKGWEIYRANTECNTALAEGWLEEFIGQTHEEERETRLTGAFGSYIGRIYPSFNPLIHVVDLPRTVDGFVKFPPNVYHRRGIDWGFSHEHPFACLWAYKDGIGRYVIYDEYWNNSQYADGIKHAEAVAKRYSWPHDPWHGASYGDPSRPDMFTTFSRAGVSVMPAVNDVHPGIDTVRRKLMVHPGLKEPMLLIDRENCPHLIKEFRVYRWMKGATAGLNPRAAKPDPLKKDDDMLDALRYLLHTDSVIGASGFQGMRSTSDPRRHGVQLMRREGVSSRLLGMTNDRRTCRTGGGGNGFSGSGHNGCDEGDAPQYGFRSVRR